MAEYDLDVAGGTSSDGVGSPRRTLGPTLRWLLVLPCAVGAYVCIYPLYLLFAWFIPGSVLEITSVVYYALTIWIGSALQGAAFVIVGSLVAPTQRSKIPLALFGLISLSLCAIYVLSVVFMGELRWESIVAASGTVPLAGLSAYLLRQKGSRK